MGPLEELRTAVEAAAAELRNGKPVRRASGRRSSARRRPGFGDYSTNAAMLLAPALGAPPREIAERLAGELSGRLGERVERVEVAGPGFLNVFLAEDWFVGALEDAAGGRRRVRRRRRRSRREGAGRVRLRQPDRPADRRERPPRRVRRRAGADPRAGRPRRSRASTTSTTPAPRSTASASRSAPARAARRCPRTATRATTWSSWREQIPGAADEDAAIAGRARASRRSWPASGPRSSAYRVHFDSWFLERTLHDGEPSAVERAIALLEEQRPRLPLRGRAVAAHDAVRRRQGPRADALERRDDLLRQRRRLPRGQARARLRPHDQPARLRPPRLHRAHEGGDGGARRRSGPARDPDPAVRAHRRGRRAAPRCPSAAATS